MPETSERAAKLKRRITKRMGVCIQDFELISEGDRILVAVSGGKDSLTLLHLLRDLQRRAPVRYELLAVHIDHGETPEGLAALEQHLAASGVPYRIEHDSIPEIVRSKTRNQQMACFLCARMRRGVLYRLAPELGCNKIALGHHLDDLVETLLMNLFHSGQLKSMPPRLYADDGRNEVIRPLAYVEEQDLIDFASLMEFPIMPCGPCCRLTSSQRSRIKRLVNELSQEQPKLRAHVLAALKNVRTTHLLDRKLFDPRVHALPREVEGSLD